MMMKATLLLLFLGLLVDLAIASWKDEIPPAKDFQEPIILSEAVFRINSFSDLEKLSGFEAVAYEEGEGLKTEVVVVRSDSSRRILVGFRGTNVNQLADIASNGRAVQVNFFDLGRAHRGFNNKLLEDDLHIRIKDHINSELAKYPSYDVVVTGHSLGAALATLFATWLVAKKELDQQKRVMAFPFGSPRVGNTALRKTVHGLQDLAVYRLVLEEDVVCRLPGSFLNYRHMGHLIDADLIMMNAFAYYEQIGDGDKYKGVDGKDWDLTVDFRDLGDWVSDHDIGSYIAVIDFSMEKKIVWPKGFELAGKSCSWWKFWC